MQGFDNRHNCDLAKVLLVATVTEGCIVATSSMYKFLVPHKLIDVATREKFMKVLLDVLPLIRSRKSNMENKRK